MDPQKYHLQTITSHTFDVSPETWSRNQKPALRLQSHQSDRYPRTHFIENEQPAALLVAPEVDRLKFVFLFLGGIFLNIVDSFKIKYFDTTFLRRFLQIRISGYQPFNPCHQIKISGSNNKYDVKMTIITFTVFGNEDSRQYKK